MKLPSATPDPASAPMPIRILCMQAFLDPETLAAARQRILAMGAAIEGERWLTAPGQGIFARGCLEWSATIPASEVDSLRQALLSFAEASQTDCLLLPTAHSQRLPAMVAFDMDSTLIQGEVIDELARLAGVGQAVSAITAAAMRGELVFQESFRRRVALLRGLPEQSVLSLIGSIPLMPGAERLFAVLHALQVRTAVLSGGFTFFGRQLQHRLGIQHLHANELDIRDGRVTGEICGEIIDGARKAALLGQLAASHGLHLHQTAAVGDGANDLPMLRLSGMGVAFHAKPLVRASAQSAISHQPLDALLYLFGLTDDEIAAAEQQGRALPSA